MFVNIGCLDVPVSNLHVFSGINISLPHMILFQTNIKSHKVKQIENKMVILYFVFEKNC